MTSHFRVVVVAGLLSLGLLADPSPVGRVAPRPPRPAPRLFFTSRTIGEIRQRCAPGGDLNRSARALVHAARRDIGAPLMAEPPRLDGLKGPARGKAYKDIFLAIRPPCAQMATCALAYLLTGDAALGSEAKRRVLHFTGFDPKGSTNTFHNDEPAMSILRRGCRAYDWTRDLYTPTERAAVERCLVIRAQDVYRLLRKHKFHLKPRDSHLGRQIGFLLEACIALEPEHPEMAPWRAYVLDIYRNVYPAWGGADGGWNEGPHYWSYYMNFGFESLLANRLAGGEDFLHTKPFFRSTPWYFIYQCPPGSPISPFGDGNQDESFYPTALRSLASVQEDPALDWFADQAPALSSGDMLTYLLPKRLPAARPTDLPGTRLFPSVGLVCSHSDVTAATNDVAFYFRASPYGSVSHGHNDQNCFALTAWGEPLAIPTGYYNFYGSPHHDLWTRSTRAKCGITYDDVPSQIRGMNAASRIFNYRVEKGWATFSGDATAAYGGALTKAVRDVVRLGRDVFVIRDTLASPTPRSFKYWLHAVDKMQVDELAQTVTIARPRATLTVQFLANSTPPLGGTRSVASVSPPGRGTRPATAASPPGRGTRPACPPPPLTFTQTDAYDPPPREFVKETYTNRWHLAAATQPCTETTIFSVLTVRRPTETDLPSVSFEPGRAVCPHTAAPSASDRACRSATAVVVSSSTTTYTVNFPPDGAPTVTIKAEGQAHK